MTKSWYIEHGYKLSSLIEQTEIDRAERDVINAYVLPIENGTTAPAAVREATIGQLAFLLLLQRTLFLTRAGAKTKTGYNSQEADAWAKLQQEATSCHAALETLKAQAGANPDAKVTDICKIYFKSNFINI